MCSGVPVRPEALHAQRLAFATRRDEYAAEKKRGRLRRAGLTREVERPDTRRRRKPGGKERMESRRRVRGVGGERGRRRMEDICKGESSLFFFGLRFFEVVFTERYSKVRDGIGK